MNKPTIKQAAIGAGIFLTGGLTGWITANQILAKKYAALADEAIADVKVHYSRPQQRYTSPAEAVADLIPEEQVVEYNTATTELPDDPVLLVDTRQNVFEQALTREEENQLDGNASPRDPDRPYLISVGEYMTGELDYDQISIDYYELDDTLCDEQESIVPDVEYTIGEESLNHFGEISGDPDTLYVRNEKLSTDFEVTRHEGAFSVEVLGIDPNLLEPPTKARTRKKSERDD